MNHQDDLFGSQDDEGAAGLDEWRGFMGVAGSLVYRGTTAEQFLNWVARYGGQLLPGLSAAAPSPEDAARMLRALGVQVWNQMPQPDSRWQIRPMKRPGRNEACWCGSGDKYKHCCEPMGVGQFPRLNMLRFVLDACPATRLADVANGHPDLDAVADTAHQWCEEGQSKRAVALLEPFFAAPRPLTLKLEILFDELMSALLDEGRDKRREHWIVQVLERGDNPLKSTALQRRATLRSDRGDAKQAWADFAQAQQLNPNDPALSMLEVTMLMAEDRMEQAAERARRWALHLGKQRDPAYADIVARLDDFGRNPADAMFGIAREMLPGVDRLASLLARAPAVTVMHRLIADTGVPDPEELGLVPMAQVKTQTTLLALELKWRKVFPQAKPSLVMVQNESPEVWDKADAWLDLLQREPALWNSFDVLDDLVMALDALQMAAVVDSLLVPLAERAAELLRLLLESHGSPVRLPWAMLDHRPVLRPVAHLAYVCKQAGKWDRFMELARWLVFELNPHDNHGLRDDLSFAFMLHARDRDALALRQRYPDDCSPTLDLNQVLAQYRLGELAAAQATWDQARRDHPKAAAMLLKPSLKPVKPDPWGVELGGAFEAWLYVQPHRPLWEQSGALDWARSLPKRKAR